MKTNVASIPPSNISTDMIDATKDEYWDSVTYDSQLMVSDGSHQPFISSFIDAVGKPKSKVAMKGGQYFDTSIFNESKKMHHQINNSLLLPTTGSTAKKQRGEGILSCINKGLEENKEVIVISPSGEKEKNTASLEPNPLPDHYSTPPHDTELKSALLMSLDVTGEKLYRNMIAHLIDESSPNVARARHLLNHNNRQAAIDFCAGCHTNGITNLDTICCKYDALFGAEY